MKKSKHNILNKGVVYISILLFVCMFPSCNPSKYVAKDKYLLDKSEIQLEANRKNFDKEEINAYIRQKPNKRILGFKFHLWLYNRSSKKSDKGDENWLRKIGEPPVVYDEFLTERSANQLKQYFNNKGYYHSTVSDTTLFYQGKFRKKYQYSKVIYDINPGIPYVVHNIDYGFEDTSLAPIILNDTVRRKINPGDIFDIDVLQQERSRLEKYLQNLGYYNFRKEYLFFEADSSIGNNQVDITLVLKKFRKTDSELESRFIEENHSKYRINNLYIHSDYNQKLALKEKENYYTFLDTLEYLPNTFFLSRESHPVKVKSLIPYIYIQPGQLYNISNIEKTYNHLSTLRVYRLTQIRFVETGVKTPDGEYLLDCVILLSASTKQSFTTEVEMTNSENIGAGVSLSYNNKNLFGGAENFSFRVRGAIEALPENTNVTPETEAELSNEKEFGLEASISTPKFLLPWNTQKFVKKFQPKSSLSLAYTFQQRPDYLRNNANASFGYVWRGNKYLTHVINPIELNVIKSDLTSGFEDEIRNRFIWYSFQSQYIASSSYSLTHTNQKKNRDFHYLKFNFESAGSIITHLNKLFKIAPNDSSRYELFGLEYAQYLRSDIDFRYYQRINESDKIVYRIFIGAGIPYQNSKALPWEKKYFSGGANSMRAWQARELGPGVAEDEDFFTYNNNTGDIKLEMNLEYRFQLFWRFEGALFADVGNVWAYNEEERAGAIFKPNLFYKQLGVASGMGLRLDIDFLIFRLDYAVKARNPINQGNEWIFGNLSDKSQKHGAVSVGIGYPF